MKRLFINTVSKKKQYLLSLVIVIAISAICYGFTPYLGYRVVALILLVTVSLIAITFDIFPVLLAAVLSAFIWDFFFIPPRFTLHVTSTDDAILLFMYFIIAMVNAVLTYKIRQIEKVARQKEEKANAIKLYNTLLNSLSHELRTPIATIIGATDNLQENNVNLTPGNKTQLLSEISKAGLRLNQQVENLLNISRLESGFIKPKLDWCDINEIVYAIVKRIEENKVGQKIIININQSLPLIKSDKGMLEQILFNLINNAVLYSETNSIIHISAMCHADILRMIVEDNGKGFPAEELENVFEKFYRLKETKTSGTGLGLSIVKGFAEALDGSVHLENISTGGARFTVSIPVKKSYTKA
jgi:two-component system, OmpR family, sensor histidine kinase KdpD